MSTSPLADAGAPPGGWPNPRRGFLFFLGLAAIGAGMANMVPLLLTVSLKATAIDAARAGTILSIVSVVGSVVGLVSFPVLGRTSDRTTARLGRRRPFLLLGAVLLAIGAVVTAAAGSVALLAVAAVFTAAGYCAVTVACTATLADQLAPARRGPASALVGLSVPVGAVAGLFVAQLFAPDLTLMILVPAAVGVLGALAFALALRDRQLSPADRPRFDLRQFLTTFWLDPVAHPSYGWAWWSRLLLFLGVAAVQAYQAFYLIAVLHIPPAEVAGAIFLSTLALTGVALVVAPISGKVSDRVGRRKPFVVAAALVFAVGLALAATADTFGSFLVAMAIIGLGQGVYFAVDIALVTEVLPDPANPGKDLGIMNLANTLPASIVPALAPAVLAIGATADMPENYAALFLFGAVAGLLGAVLILPIRKVR